MATIRRHYDALRKALGAVMILYLLFLGVQFALAMRDGAQAHQTERIEQLERRIDRLDHGSSWQQLMELMASSWQLMALMATA